MPTFANMADNVDGQTLPKKQLDKELVADTSAWRLLLRISPSELYVMAYNPHSDNSLITASIELTNDSLKSLEEAVYDNTFLLKEFARIDVICDSSAFMLLPASTTEEQAAELLSEAFPDAPNNILEDTLMPLIKLVYCLDAPLEGFIRRTFFNARLHHRLTPLVQYFINGVKGNALRMYVNVCPSGIDVVALSHGQLLLANTFNSTSVEDAIYYILSVREMLFKQQLSEGQRVEILLSGSQTQRAALVPLLSRYAPPVAPVIFPSTMFNAGNSSMESPFDLTVTSLCE